MVYHWGLENPLSNSHAGSNPVLSYNKLKHNNQNRNKMKDDKKIEQVKETIEQRLKRLQSLNHLQTKTHKPKTKFNPAKFKEIDDEEF